MSRPAVILIFLVLNSCALFPEKPVQVYQLSRMQNLQHQLKWFFSGRLNLTNEKDSVSASISWRHLPEQDDIELLGPLAQGRLAITLFPDKIIFDDGEHRRQYSGRIDDVLAEQLGFDLPAHALRFWVLGVNDPQQAYTEVSEGFMQNGWLVRYKELLQVNTDWLPKKISAEKDKTRVKLVIDQWELS
ncbi:MAG: lipoprotein insertase outer membrane protein LolB [Methylomonas sp.]|jgi:outer membrane lipoprotein LolB